MIDAGNGWIVGSLNTKLRYTQDSWQVENQGQGSCLYAVDVSGSGFGWAAGFSGVTWRFTAGEWVKMSTATSTSVTGIAIVDRERAWMVGDGGLILSWREHGVYLPFLSRKD
jgi:hypothetical protein